MAEEASAPPQSMEGEIPAEAAAAEDMEVEAGPAENPKDSEPSGAAKPEENGGGGSKRGRGEGEEEAKEEEEEDDDASKRRKVERSVEEERLEKLEAKGSGEGGVASEEEEEDDGQDGGEATPVTVGPKVFSTSVEMFDYFYKLLHSWSPNLDLNKYEHLALLDLLQKGHAEPCKKTGEGIQAFQVRYHPTWKSRCFFVVRVDGTVEDFSFRKCVDHLLPLPENMKTPSASNGKKIGSHQKGGGSSGHRGGRGGGRGGGGRGRGRGRGGWRGK